MKESDFTMDCTGDVVVGDTICYTESVWGGSYQDPKNLGERTIIAEIIKDSYGEKKQQHTFTFTVINSWGHNALKKGLTTRRKGRNIYKNGTKRLPWACRDARTLALNEKHARGSQARAARKIRIELKEQE
jgi:(S)-2-hydroxy-acid oxidase